MTPKPWQHNGRLSQWLVALLDLLYPPHCVACDTPGSWFCTNCAERSPLLEPSTSCDAPITRHGKNHLLDVRSVAYHLPPIQRAVHALKYEGLRAVAIPLGDLLAACWRQRPAGASVIVPVPLHAKRLRERGYNQAELLARALGARLDLPVRPDVLIRQRDTRSQVGLSAEERWANVNDAFYCPERLPDDAVLLIDDVYTTGATLQACAQALLQGGAREVRALTLTRAMDPADRAGGI